MSGKALQNTSSHQVLTKDHYDLSPALWRPILGKDMNYHFGYFKDVDPQDYEGGLRAIVSKLASNLERGSTVLDIGCGWGGPARQLIRDLGCKVDGITNSQAQAKYSSLNFPVKVLDVEKEDIKGAYDTIWILESLEHIFDKRKFLKRIRQNGKKLILSTCCCHDSMKKTLAYDGTILLKSLDSLLKDLTESGWKVQSIDERKKYGIPTLFHWYQRIKNTYPKEKPGPIKTLWKTTIDGLSDIPAYIKNIPLLDIVAM